MASTLRAQPHDSFFKMCLQHRELAEDFFQGCLPVVIKKRCEFSTLALESASYVEADFRSHHADLLYGVEIDGKQGFLYLLLEHQSTPDRWMALWMLRYMTSVFKRSAEKWNHLPVVVPLVVYAGKVSPYPYSCDFMDCFQDSPLARSVFLEGKESAGCNGLEEKLLRTFFLVDLTTMTDHELSQFGKAEIKGMLLKNVLERDMFTLVKMLFEICQLHDLEGAIFSMALYYIASNVSYEGSEEELLAILREETEKYKYKEEVMTLEQILINKGLKKGREEGLEEGIQMGKWETSHTIAKKLLQEGADEAFVMRVTDLSLEEIRNLKRRQPNH